MNEGGGDKEAEGGKRATKGGMGVINYTNFNF